MICISQFQNLLQNYGNWYGMVGEEDGHTHQFMELRVQG